jgi:hypothetical protein
MCLPCATPSNGTVVTVAPMAKKDAASKRLIRPKTPGDYLARLRQFEPRPSPFADLQDPFGKTEDMYEKRIDDVLSAFMARYIRDTTKQDSFLKDAKRAIAGYVGARETEYDRRKARKLLSATSIVLETAGRKLQEIARWPELSNYLKYIFRDAPYFEREIKPRGTSQKQVELDPDSYSDFAPDKLQLRLSQLETVVSLAAERVTFGPGDAQRDQIAQDFTDQLASAWRRATKTWPTCSRPTRRLKNASPFARLLETINQKLLEERHRSPNNFREHGIKSVKHLRQLIKPDC